MTTEKNRNELLDFCKENFQKKQLLDRYSDILFAIDEIKKTGITYSSEYFYLRLYKADALYLQSERENALTKLIELHLELQSTIFPEIYVLVCSYIGKIYSLTSNFFEAINYFSKVLEIYEGFGDKAKIASTLNNLGSAYRNTGNIPKSLELLYKSLQINEELKDKEGIAFNLSNIGLLYYYLSDYSMAMDYFEQAKHLNIELNNHKSLAVNLGNIGNIYVANGEFLEALQFFKQALEILEKEENSTSISAVIGNIGDIYLRTQDYENANNYLQKALKIDEKNGNKRGISIRLVNLAYLFKSIGYEDYNLQKAKDFCNQSLEIALEIGYSYVEFQNYKCLSEIYEALDDYTNALAYHKKFYNTEKTLMNEDSKKQAQFLSFNRKIESTERERQVKLARFQEQERLLHDILPSKIANRILQGETTISEHNENVSIFFSDIVGFTEISQSIDADSLVKNLNRIFQEFDSLAKKYSIEKIKTIGDAYMAVSGLNKDIEHSQYNIAMFALEALEISKSVLFGQKSLQIRIGLHIGNVVSGVIGGYKFSYDIWGDSVNIASRMESHSEPGRIHVTEAFANKMKKYPEFNLIPRGDINIKGKGSMNTFWMEIAK